MTAVSKVLACSPFVAGVRDRQPELFERWLTEDFFSHPLVGADLRLGLEAEVTSAQTEADVMRALRQARAREMARIAFRDLAGVAELDETLGALSDLADVCCTVALDWAGRRLDARLGAPHNAGGRPVRPVILGMGKLGGRELNFSSDIDLILAYTESGETQGVRSVANEEYFARLALDFTRLLTVRTEDGFVFRVDWMLRPFGASGPPAMSFAMMEDYYQVHGREWERYALIKARPVAGDLEAGGHLLAALRPFVYRRYLDFNAVGNLRELKRKIQEDMERRGLRDNVKLGPGGIREVEFTVQAFQLMRGGQEPALRDNRLRAVLRYLGDAGHVPAKTAQALDQAYVFLRRTENAIQMYADEQTHALPESPAARMALCQALDFPDWESFRTQLDQVRGRVQEEFERVFSERKTRTHSGHLERVVHELWSDGADSAAMVPDLHAAGFAQEPEAVGRELAALRQTHLVKSLSDNALARLTAMLPLLLEDAARQPQPETAAQRVLKVVNAIAGRSTYLTLLRESEVARSHLISLCAASPWITDFLAQHPVLLDQLLDPRALFAPPTREQMEAELAEALANCAPGDTEALMNALRRYRQEAMLRIAAADVMHALPLVKVSDHLTWLAETILRKTLELTRRDMRAQYGEALRADGTPAGLGVIAYGKFGGIEMGYGSDLDVVFLHDCDALDADTSGGPKRIPNEVWLARLAQRIVSWLTMQTSAGRVYEVDLELRPDGRRGLMVSSVAAFEQYQRESAWTWEHQALTRARPVAGSPAILAAFSRIRYDVLTCPRDPEKLQKEIIDMRGRMKKHREKKIPGLFDVKQGEGGLTDIEFITQFLVLRDAPRCPALIEWSDNWRQTEALVAAGVLSADAGHDLVETYRTYRAWLHTRDLQQAEPLMDSDLARESAERVGRLWRQYLSLEGR